MNYKFIYFFLMVSSVALSATIAVDDTAGGAINSNGLCSITEAMEAANTDTAVGDCPAGDSGSDTIEISTNITLTERFESDITHGGTGTPAIVSEITINGNGYTIQRDSSLACNDDSISDASEFRIFRVSDVGTLSLNNIRLKHGCVNGNGGSINKFKGGAIKSEGTLSIENSEVKFSSANVGGGIYSSGPLPVVNNNIISDNSAFADGGGIQNFGSITTFSNNIVSDNSTGSTDSEGGGIYQGNATVALFDNNTISRNGAIYGSGLMNRGIINALNNSTFYNNEALYGGGIRNAGTIVAINNSTFSNNEGDDNGGAISNIGSIDNINNSSFFGNFGGLASDGGAIYNSVTNAITLNNSLFHNNSADNGDDCYSTPGNIFTGTNNMSDNNFGGCPGQLATLLSTSTVNPIADNGCVIPTADGSCTKTHALNSDSEAVDEAVSGTANDQRGFGSLGTRDIGAFEYMSAAVRCLALGMDVTSDFSKTVTSAHELNQALYCANLFTATTDTIIFANNIILNRVEDNDATYGHTGTNPINSSVIIDGMGYILERDSFLGCNNDGITNDSEFRLLRVGPAGDLDLKNLVLKRGCVDGNSNTETFYGGALLNSGDLVIAKTAFLNNKAHRGGAVYNEGLVTAIRKTTFFNNQASAGGAGFNAGTLTKLSNSTVSGNSVDNLGGGFANTGTLTEILNVTFSGNSGVNGGALSNSSSGEISSLNNSLFHNNTATGSGNDCYNNGGTQNGSNNISDNASSECNGMLATTLTPTTLGDLEDNDCVTPFANGNCIKTHALLVGSEAIDQGDVNATNQDQRGYAINNIRDLGAYEYDSPDDDRIFINGFE